jgi:hypothetical protein
MTFTLQPSYTKNGPKPNTLSQHHRPAAHTTTAQPYPHINIQILIGKSIERVRYKKEAAHTTTAQPYPYINIQILIGKSIERVRYKKEEKLLKRGFWVSGVRFQFWDDCYKIR